MDKWLVLVDQLTTGVKLQKKSKSYRKCQYCGNRFETNSKAEPFYCTVFCERDAARFKS